VLTIRLPDGTVTADLNAKSLRRAIAAIREQGTLMFAVSSSRRRKSSPPFLAFPSQYSRR
jgi:hypothetical protein